MRQLRLAFLAFLVLLGLTLLAAPAWAQIAFLGSTSIRNVNSTDVTAVSSAVDTSGATLIIAGTCGNGATTTISDTALNTYTNLASSPNSASTTISRFSYIINPTNSATMVFTATHGVGARGSGKVAWFSGTGIYDSQHATADAGSGTTLKPGTLTPSTALSLFVSVVCHGDISTDSITASIDLSYTGLSDEILDGTSGSHFGIDMAYLIQSGSAAASDPTWTLSSSQPQKSANHAIFRPAVATNSSGLLLLLGAH